MNGTRWIVLCSLAALATACGEEGPPPESEALPARLAVQMKGHPILDLRFVDGEMVLCQLAEATHPACALSYARAGTQRLFKIDTTGQVPGAAGAEGAEGESSGGGSPLLALGGSVAGGGGGGGPSFSAEANVATSYNGAPVGLENIEGGGASVEAFAASSFDAGGPAVAASMNAGVGGACNPVAELCALTVEIFQYLPARFTQGMPRISYGQCVTELSGSAELINSALVCQYVAFLRCVLPHIGRLFQLLEGANAANAQQVGAAGIAAIQQCAHFVPGIMDALSGDGGDSPDQLGRDSD